ncbi:Type-1 restriction enzyme EcoKI specificity protein [subsurface metagenome]
MKSVDCPDNWQQLEFGALVKDMGDGGTPPRNKPEYFSGDINWCTVTDIKRFINDTEEKISVLGLRNSSAKLWPENSVILSTGATIGEVGIVKIKTATKQGLTGIVLKEDKADATYIYYLLSSITNLLKRYSQGSTFREIRPPILSRIPVLVPPLLEQRKIAEILSMVDETIEKTDAIVKETQQLKKGLMQKLFSEGIGHTRFKETEIGQIPEEWELPKLLELSVDGINNGVFNDPQKVGRGYKLINVKDMYSGSRIDTDNLSLLDLESAEFARSKVMYGDIFFTRSSLVVKGIGFCNINLSRDDNMTYDGHLMRIRLDSERVFPQYLVTFCKTAAARRYLISIGKTTTMTTLSQRDLGGLPVACPPMNEQHRIAGIISEVDTKIEVEQALKSGLEQFKKGLMQVLLTGKVRVKV